MSDNRPTNCRFRLLDEGKPYPKSGCTACGADLRTLGKSCQRHPMTQSSTDSSLVERLREGPVRTGATEDGEYELFDVEEAAQTMHEAASRISTLERELEEARALVIEANNSLYGSHGYFHSLNGGPFDKYHLSTGIENLKSACNSRWHALTAAEAYGVKVTDKMVDDAFDGYLSVANIPYIADQPHPKDALRVALSAALENGWGTIRRMKGSELYEDATRFADAARSALQSEKDREGGK